MQRFDSSNMSQEDLENMSRLTDLIFDFNHTRPSSKRYEEIQKEIFSEQFGEGSRVVAPVQGSTLNKVHIGKNVFINANSLMMARGGIIIEDNVQIAANSQLISNNHDEYNRSILTLAPVVIKEGAWLGAGATVLPGVTVGKHAIVGANATVTKDVPDYAVVVGSPAKVIKYLDKDKFED